VPTTYADALHAILLNYANPTLAGPMRTYMKGRFPFFGIKSPLRVELVRDFVADHGLPAVDEIEPVAVDLWDAPERECQYAALDLIERSAKRLTPESVAWLKRLDEVVVGYRRPDRESPRRWSVPTIPEPARSVDRSLAGRGRHLAVADDAHLRAHPGEPCVARVLRPEGDRLGAARILEDRAGCRRGVRRGDSSRPAKSS